MCLFFDAIHALEDCRSVAPDLWTGPEAKGNACWRHELPMVFGSHRAQDGAGIRDRQMRGASCARRQLRLGDYISISPIMPPLEGVMLIMLSLSDMFAVASSARARASSLTGLRFSFLR